MIYSARIENRFSLLGEAILREGFFSVVEEVCDAEKTEATLPNARVYEPYRPKKLLLRDARENDAEAL